MTGERATGSTDRVLATVMFTDIVGSTELAGRLGDRRWHDLLDHHHHATVRREFDRHRGVERNTTGDGFLATFDGPARAIRCGAAIQDELRRLGLPITIGIHTGEVELRGDDIAGIGVHLAARVAAQASEGEILVSRTVVDLVAGSGLRFDDRGQHVLKGMAEKWQLLAVAT